MTKRDARVEWLKEHRGTVGVLAQMVVDHEERIAELEAELKKWLTDFSRTGDGHSIAVPVHQIERLLTKSNG